MFCLQIDLMHTALIQTVNVAFGTYKPLTPSDTLVTVILSQINPAPSKLELDIRPDLPYVRFNSPPAQSLQLL